MHIFLKTIFFIYVFIINTHSMIEFPGWKHCALNPISWLAAKSLTITFNLNGELYVSWVSVCVSCRFHIFSCYFCDHHMKTYQTNLTKQLLFFFLPPPHLRSWSRSSVRTRSHVQNVFPQRNHRSCIRNTPNLHTFRQQPKRTNQRYRLCFWQPANSQATVTRPAGHRPRRHNLRTWKPFFSNWKTRLGIFLTDIDSIRWTRSNRRRWQRITSR